MVGLAVFLLTFFISVSSFAGQRTVCIVNSYTIRPAKEVEEKVREILSERGYQIVGSGCDVKVLIGTPAVVDELTSGDNCKKVYTFVLFPEKFGLDRKKKFFGVRIFPLPIRTYRRFLKHLCLKEAKVAVPVSRDMLPIARIYLSDKHFVIIPFNSSPSEVFGKLMKYRCVYIFPDPKVLKIINLTTLLSFGRDNGIMFFSGLSDLARFGLDYVDRVDYDRLAKDVVFLVERDPKEKILPCPVR